MADVLVFNESIRLMDIMGALVIVLITAGVSLHKMKSKANQAFFALVLAQQLSMFLYTHQIFQPRPSKSKQPPFEKYS